MSTEQKTQKTEAPRTEAPRTETPRTETPKADPFMGFDPKGFDPMAYWAASQAGFQKLVTDAFQRAQSFADQYATLEAQMVNRAQGAVASWAQLTQDAIAYGAQLSAEARKLSFEAARKMSRDGA